MVMTVSKHAPDDPLTAYSSDYPTPFPVDRVAIRPSLDESVRSTFIRCFHAHLERRGMVDVGTHFAMDPHTQEAPE
jgi:hypothetical protein